MRHWCCDRLGGRVGATAGARTPWPRLAWSRFRAGEIDRVGGPKSEGAARFGVGQHGPCLVCLEPVLPDGSSVVVLKYRVRSAARLSRSSAGCRSETRASPPASARFYVGFSRGEVAARRAATGALQLVAILHKITFGINDIGGNPVLTCCALSHKSANQMAHRLAHSIAGRPHTCPRLSVS